MGKKPEDKAQRAYIKAKLKAGCIIHIHCDFLTPPHNKFIVIIHVDFDDNLLLFFLINSKIHPLLENNPALKACQLDIRKETYSSLLKFDSYLDCSRVFDDLDIDDVINHLLHKPNDFKGNLVEDDIQSIIEIVVGARTISEYDKDLIIQSLGN